MGELDDGVDGLSVWTATGVTDFGGGGGGGVSDIFKKFHYVLAHIIRNSICLFNFFLTCHP